ncbi:aldose epimerase family protein [Chryseobacterium wangxinyae]|uniref:aldose epimerase family protein n=1 Tax=Chryseobacterium sp. CY353 TaxID=2997334 RepID=UPI0022707901|nr:aldose epimerase family protein [Chryseobacterium sp. CY353]MCY0970443.1 galactose mutarotase [Chryseobacterium sp. CY353]
MKKTIMNLIILFAVLCIFGCNKKETNQKTQSEKMDRISVSDYGVTAKGDSIKKYTLTNKNGMKAEVINFGGIITSLTAPDREGKYEDIVLGFTKPEDYFTGNSYYFGALIGRFGNRIANAKFTLEGKTYNIDQNDGTNSLHGGKEGFHTKLWKIEAVRDAKFPTLKLTYTSADGEEGYPGKLSATVLYTLTDNNSLEIFYEATTDKATVVNLTQHSYFNLSGKFNKTVADHELQINADNFLPVNGSLIPTGEQKAVKGTPFDFTVLKPIGKDINSEDDQLKKGKGYDHNWIPNGKGLRSIAKVSHPESGRVMEVLTDEPGVQFYSGNFLDGKFDTKTGGKNEFRTGFCLETQHFPDSPNQASFPSTELKPGHKYHSKTIYKFSVKK